MTIEATRLLHECSARFDYRWVRRSRRRFGFRNGSLQKLRQRRGLARAQLEIRHRVPGIMRLGRAEIFGQLSRSEFFGYVLERNFVRIAFAGLRRVMAHATL